MEKIKVSDQSIDRAMLLGFTLPDEEAEALFKIDPIPAVQTHNFAKSLVRALHTAHDQVFLLSAAPVQNFPHVPRLWFGRRNFVTCETSGVTIPFINLLGLKHITRFLACVMSLPLIKRWRISVVYVHGVHSPFLFFAGVLRLIGCRVIVVLTDPPGVALPKDRAISRLLKRLDRRIVKALISRVNGVVTLSSALALAWAPCKPALVVPGISSGAWRKLIAKTHKATPQDRLRPRVLYAGGLSAAYGVDRLIEAAALLPDIDFVFYGKGEQLSKIVSDDFPNITYGGFLRADELVREVLASDLLINPRPSDTEIAIGSFPSKLLEYLATGIPVLTTRIRSIPVDLAEQFQYIDDESVVGMSIAIRETLAKRETLRSQAQGSPHIVEKLYGEASSGLKLRDFVGKIS